MPHGTPLFGLVPFNSFSYSPTRSAPTPSPLPPVPTDPLPLTTRMDYLNVMPDNGMIDGIVHAAADLSSFGNDTGTVTFTAQNGTAQVYLPVTTDLTGALPVNAYLMQGAFGSAEDGVGNLLSQDVTVTNASQDGLPWAYSLDTHVRLNMLVNDANNHIKRLEVIRPGGNAVVFDFAWDATTGMFSPTGTPEGWNGRDANQTYVLRSLNTPGDDVDLNYELLFADGIVQTFNGAGVGPFGSVGQGTLTSVSDASTGLMQQVPGVPLPYALRMGMQDTTDSPRYNLMLDWSDGDLSKLEYQTKDQSRTIDAAISYGGDGGNDVAALDKTDGGNPIPEFSYSISGGTITHDGVTVTRSGSVSSGSVTIETDLPADPGFAAGSKAKEVYTFDAHDLVTSDALTLDEGDGQPTTATTTYQYQADVGRYDNGAPSWSKVVLVTNPDQSWVGYTYDGKTGWVTGRVTPFQSSTWTPPEAPGDPTDTSADRFESYGYDPSDAGNGQAPDPNLLVQPPRTASDFVLGTPTGETFYRYGAADGSDTITMRRALGDGQPPAGKTPWQAAGLFSTTTIGAFDASSTTSVTGDVSTTKSANSSTGIINDTVISSWFNDTLAQSTGTTDAFGDATSSTDESLGAAYQSDTAGTKDPFGRPLTQSLSGGQSVTNSYTFGDGTTSWFGPASVTEADGSTTKYTYTPLGQVASKVIYAGTGYSLMYGYAYDAAGHVVRTTVSPADSSGNPSGPGLVTTYAFDAQGRLTQQVTNAGGTDLTANKTTSYAYSFDGTYNVTSVTNSDGSTDSTKTYLDGSDASLGGSDQTPGTDAEGVVASDTTDDNGNAITAGSTWVLSSSDGGKSWTRAYTNVLGEQYLVQQSDPSSSAAPGADQSYSDSVTSFDGNLRPIETVGFDGTDTHTVYDPLLGTAAETWVDVNGNGVFDVGVDTKTVTHPTALATSDAAHAGDDSDALSTDGSQDDLSQSWAGGLDSAGTVDGMTTTTVESLPSGPGAYTVTTTNPDGTKDVQTYADGLLMQDQQLGADGSTIATTTNTYDGMRRLASVTDNTGTTNYHYYEDGTPMSSQDPGHNASTDNTPDPNADQTQTITRPDGTTQTQVTDAQGNLVGQGGAGVLQATFGYDTANTGNLNSLTTYGTVTATTNWEYDPNTGQLLNKKYADGTENSFRYNAAGKLGAYFGPGVVGTFGYDARGRQTSSRYNDTATGLVQSTVQQEDDQGRPLITTDTDNGRSFTTTDAYTTLGDLKTETFGSAGNATVGYGYYPTSGFGSTGSPDGLQTMTVTAAGGSAQQAYTYESGGKRLKTITVNGVTITYVYLPNSNQLQSMTVGNVVTTFTPDGSDGSRLGSMSVAANGQSLYAAGYVYNELNQRTNDVVTRTVVDNSGNATSENDNRVYTYDPSQADSLTQVQDANGNTLYSFSYDGVGNFKNNATLGSANSVNEYSNLTYNLRHDLTNDGIDAYGYDALDRLTGVTPDSPTSGSLAAQYGYDGQGRMAWEDVYTWAGSWVLSTTYHFAWSGDELVAKLDANNALLQQYTWGPGQNGTDQVIALTNYTSGGPQTYALVYDASGNVSMMLDPLSGSVVASYSYAPYGALVSANGPEAGICPFGFKGYWTDFAVDPNVGWSQPATAYQTVRNDEFVIGKWMQDDPSGINGGLDSSEPFANDPINNIDTNGLVPQWLKNAAAKTIIYGKAAALDATDFALNAAIGWGEVNIIPAIAPKSMRPGPSRSLPGSIGRNVGHVVAIVQGASEVSGGASVDAGGVLAVPVTFGGSLVVEIPGTAAIVHGGLVVVNGVAYGVVPIGSGSAVGSVAAVFSTTAPRPTPPTPAGIAPSTTGGTASGPRAGAGGSTRGGDIHHIMTNKNKSSTAAGGPYTPKFEELAARRGITLEAAMNKMRLPGHQGPHAEYNKAVFERLDAATQGLYGDAYNTAFDKALEQVRLETATPGTLLNRLATGG